MQPLIPENVKPLALQAILFFVLANIGGKTRSEAVAAFVGSALCRAFGDGFDRGQRLRFRRSCWVH